MNLPLFDHDTMPSGAQARRPQRVDVDVERLSRDLGDLAAAHACPTCARSPGHRFELLRALGARLHPEARDRLELIELAGHLAWASK